MSEPATPIPDDRAFLGHPKGLGYLAMVEGCERFSYYSMQTLLVLYMVKYLLRPEHVGNVTGLAWLQSWHYAGLEGQPLASALFGDYTSLVYLTPILGGVLADRWLGRRAALIAGALIMSLGHFLMAIEGAFLFALLSLIVGVGLFKGNIASQVSELYEAGDLRRATAFQIYYMAISGSVIVAPLIAGTLGERVGWHYGFGTAGIVMVLGLLLYLKAGPWLPAERTGLDRTKTARPKLQPGDGWRVMALIALVPILALAHLVNQQLFNVFLIWGDERFDLRAFGFVMPTSWLITFDAAIAFAIMGAMVAFWKWYAKRHREPDELGKLIIGTLITIFGGLLLVFVSANQGGGKISLYWPLAFIVINEIGFANISPVALALFSKIAPPAIGATVIGIFYLSFFLCNKAVGIVGGWYSTMPTSSFWLVHVAASALALAAFVLFKLVLSHRLNGGVSARP